MNRTIKEAQRISDKFEALAAAEFDHRGMSDDYAVLTMRAEKAARYVREAAKARRREVRRRARKMKAMPNFFTI